ncbi:hypothetical protein [Natrialba aegyptia]|uniref:Uncharacterized protein n=1 Tax=Natrialba aegyptia DSM 13077 TaxID=1227491 RepID=M0B6N2_9EURY|nr:hypothetical protein [Natrialba aegyptia]ELZ05309.1 hypothetical protein C480_10515 [Natrialba aegyptia DSM 13077]
MSGDKVKQEFGVLIRAWGPDDEPGEARHHEYVVDAIDEDEAKEKAADEAKNNFVHGIVGTRDSYEVLEVENYGEVPA